MAVSAGRASQSHATSDREDSRQDVLVELLSAAQKLSDHLSAQPFSLQDEPGDAHRCVGHKAPLYQVLDPLLWLPVVETRFLFFS